MVAVPAEHAAGEDEVLAAVVTTPGSELTATALWEWCDERIPDFAVPRYLRFADALPQTPSGKVRKRDLRTEGISAPGVVDRTTVSG